MRLSLVFYFGKCISLGFFFSKCASFNTANASLLGLFILVNASDRFFGGGGGGRGVSDRCFCFCTRVRLRRGGERGLFACLFGVFDIVCARVFLLVLVCFCLCVVVCEGGGGGGEAY